MVEAQHAIHISAQPLYAQHNEYYLHRQIRSPSLCPLRLISHQGVPQWRCSLVLRPWLVSLHRIVIAHASARYPLWVVRLAV